MFYRRPEVPNHPMEDAERKAEKIRDQELTSTKAQRVFYIVVAVVLLVLLIVAILGANVFHFL